MGTYMLSARNRAPSNGPLKKVSNAHQSDDIFNSDLNLYEEETGGEMYLSFLKMQNK